MARNIGQFRLVEQISAGSVGAVWRAVQTPLDRPVALKELHPNLVKDPAFIARFEREAKAAATLDHENVVRVIDFGRHEDTYFLAMEFVEGINLDDLLADCPKLPPSVVYTIARDVLAALIHAHEHGVVHRDLKPANIMLSNRGIAKLADFSITTAHTAPRYMSPEQFSNHPVIDGRTDLYSLGVVLYQTFSGRLPFPGTTFEEVKSSVLGSTPTPLSAVAPFASARLSRLVLKALSRDPRARFVNAREFLTELDVAAVELGIKPDRVGTARIVGEPLTAEAMYQREANALVARRLELAEREQQQAEESVLTLNHGPVEETESIPKSKRTLVLVAIGAVWLVAMVVIMLLFARMMEARRGPVTHATDTPQPTPTEAQWLATQRASTRTPTPELEPTENPTRTVVVWPLPDRTPQRVVTRPPTPRRTRVARRTPTPAPASPTGHVTVRSENRVGLYVDGEFLGALEGTKSLSLRRGQHEIRFQDPYSGTVSQRVQVAGGDSQVLTAQTLPASSTAGYLRLRVPSNPWATVYVDGAEVARTPIAGKIRIVPGERTLQLRNPTCRPYQRHISIKKNSTLSVRVGADWCKPQ